MNWIIGTPKEANWYIVAVRTNDPDELYYVLQLWFNPNSGGSGWWTGGGYVSNHAQRYAFGESVFAHSEMPTFSKEDRLLLQS